MTSDAPSKFSEPFEVNLEDLEPVPFSFSLSPPPSPTYQQIQLPDNGMLSLEAVSPETQVQFYQLLSEQNSIHDNISQLSSEFIQTQELSNTSQLTLVPCFHYKQVQAISTYNALPGETECKTLSLFPGEILTVLAEDDTGNWTLSWSLVSEIWGWHPSSLVSIYEEDFMVLNPYLNTQTAVEALQSASNSDTFIQDLDVLVNGDLYLSESQSKSPQAYDTNYSISPSYLQNSNEVNSAKTNHFSNGFGFSFLQNALPLLDPGVIHGFNPMETIAKPLPPIPTVQQDFSLDQKHLEDIGQMLMNSYRWTDNNPTATLDIGEVMIPFDFPINDEISVSGELFGEIRKPGNENQVSRVILSPENSPEQIVSFDNASKPKKRRRNIASNENPDCKVFQCKWTHPIVCGTIFDDAFKLYEHLKSDHVGRRHSEKGLCLQCHWEGCKMVKKKRDHITSHLVVHVPLTYKCQACDKPYKRLQDLRKHEVKDHQGSDSCYRHASQAINHPYNRNTSPIVPVPSITASDSDRESPQPSSTSPFSEKSDSNLMVTLSVHVWNTPVTRAFTITILQSASIYQLKEQIQQHLPKSFGDVKPSELDLYRCDDQVDAEDARLEFSGKPPREVLPLTLMMPLRTIAKYFPVLLDSDFLHVVVTVAEQREAVAMSAPMLYMVMESTEVDTDVYDDEDEYGDINDSDDSDDSANHESVETVVESANIAKDADNRDIVQNNVLKGNGVSMISKLDKNSSKEMTTYVISPQRKPEEQQRPKPDSTTKLLDRGTILLVAFLNYFGFGIRKRRNNEDDGKNSPLITKDLKE
ncbi:hypothetical protein HK096_010994 [Nowakowskiella sp. JEL0078]|nr:hypothetical protein HK096_010994 [Nowakowskiella sp. JEL0078]